MVNKGKKRGGVGVSTNADELESDNTDKVKVSGTATVDRQNELGLSRMSTSSGVLLKESELVSFVTNSIGALQLLSTIDNEQTWIFDSYIPKAVKVPSSAFPLKLIDINDFKPIFDVHVINVGMMGPNALESKPMIYMTVNDSYINRIRFDNYEVIDMRFDAVREFAVAVNLFSDLCTNILKYPTLKTATDIISFNYLPPEDFKARDLTKVADAIINPIIREEFRFNLRYMFKESHAKAIPEGQVSIETFYQGETPEHYRIVRLPITRHESTILSQAYNVLGRAYMHPVKALEHFQHRFETGQTRINAADTAEAYMKGNNVRVIKPSFENNIPGLMYFILSACEQAREEISSMLDLTFQAVNHNVATHLNAIFQTVQGSNSALSQYYTYINFGDANATIFQSYRSLINVNLYKYVLGSLKVDIFMDNFFAAIGIALGMTIFPPSCIHEKSRLQINNYFAYALCSVFFSPHGYLAMINELKQINALNSLILPQSLSFPEWEAMTFDFLSLMYTYSNVVLNHVINNGLLQRLEVILSAWFNSAEFSFKECDIIKNNSLSGDVEYLISTCTPWLRGRVPSKYEGDTSNNPTRMKMGMSGNGAMILGPPLDRGEITPFNGLIEYVTRKYNCVHMLWDTMTDKRDSRGKFSHTDVSRVNHFMVTTGLQSFALIGYYYACYLPRFSTSVLSDSVVQYVSPINVVMRATSFMHLFAVCAVLEPNPKRLLTVSPTYFSGSSITTACAIFLVMYHKVRALIPYSDLKRIVQKRTIVEITNNLCKILLRDDSFDISTQFSSGVCDDYDWNRFLDQRVDPDDIPLFSDIINNITQTQQLLFGAPNGAIIPVIKVDHFYLISGVPLMCGKRIPNNVSTCIMAMNAIPKDEIQVLRTIANYREYEIMSKSYGNNAVQTKGYGIVEVANDFEWLWETIDRSVDFDDVMAASNINPDGPITKLKYMALKINMPAYIQLNFHKFAGSESDVPTSPSSTISTFTEAMAKCDGKSKLLGLPPSLNIGVNVLLNDYGSCTMRRDYHKIGYAKRLFSPMGTRSTIAITYEQIASKLQFYTPGEFLDHVDGEMIVRRTPYELLDELPIRMELIPYQAPLL